LFRRGIETISNEYCLREIQSAGDHGIKMHQLFFRAQYVVKLH